MSNRVNKIHLSTKAQEWRWVPTALNPEDVVSHGASPNEEDNRRLFYNGPSYITKDVEEWPEVPANKSTVRALQVGDHPQKVGGPPQEVGDHPQEVGDCPQEVGDSPQEVSGHPQVSGCWMEVSGHSQEVSGRSQERDVGPQVITSKSGLVEDSVEVEVANRISCWSKIKRAVAYVTRFIDACRKVKVSNDHLSVRELNDAEKTIVKDIQRHHFGSEMQKIMEHDTIQAHKSFNRSSRSQVKYLNPAVDADGVLRIGGRIGKSSMECHAKFLVVLPSRNVVVERIIWFTHREYGHQVLEHTHTQLRLKWWIIKGRQQVKSMMSKCMMCKRLKSRLGNQKMSDLPEFRTNVPQVRKVDDDVPEHFTRFHEDKNDTYRRTYKAESHLKLRESAEALRCQVVPCSEEFTMNCVQWSSKFGDIG